MNKNNIVKYGVLGLILILFFWGCGKYNGMVGQDEAVKKAWNNVQVQYQRRADLIPNLIRAVQEGAKNEKDILETVTKARAGIAEAKKDIDNASTPEQIENASRKVNNVQANLMIAVEAYPNIRGTELYAKFMDDFNGTENRVATARTDFNNAIQTYNVAVRTFPGNIISNIFGFKQKDGFKAEEGAEKAPKPDLWDKKPQ